jgi:hypothetical protein
MAPTWHLHGTYMAPTSRRAMQFPQRQHAPSHNTGRLSAGPTASCIQGKGSSPDIQLRSRLRFDGEHAGIAGSGPAPGATSGYSRKRISMPTWSPGLIDLHSSWKTRMSCHSTARSLTARSFGLQPCDATLRAAHAQEAAVLRCVPAHRHPPQLTAADNVSM